jgi:hypothetical protein
MSGVKVEDALSTSSQLCITSRQGLVRNHYQRNTDKNGNIGRLSIFYYFVMKDDPYKFNVVIM